MSCTTCQENGRTCDGNGPVCDPCVQHREIFCKWATISAIDDQTSANAVWPPPGLDKSEYAQNFWAQDKCRELFDSDEEMRSLLLRTATEARCGLLQAANAVLGIVLAMVDREYEFLAIEEYQTATRLFYNALNGLDGTQRKFAAITVSLLNIFERCVIPVDVRRYTHLAGMRLVVQDSALCGSQPGAVPCAVIKSLIYHTALGSIFAFSDTSEGLQPTYISNLIAGLPRSSGHNCRRLDSIHKVPLTLLQLIYEMSFMRYKISTTTLTREDDISLRDIKERLDKYTFLEPQGRPTYGTKMMELYRRVSLLLVEKISNPSMTCRDAAPFASSCLEVLRTRMETQTPAIVWPLLVLYFAVSPDRRNAILEQLANLDLFATRSKIRRFIEHLTQLERDGSSEGENAMFDMLLAREIGSLHTIILL